MKSQTVSAAGGGVHLGVMHQNEERSAKTLLTSRDLIGLLTEAQRIGNFTADKVIPLVAEWASAANAQCAHLMSQVEGYQKLMEKISELAAPPAAKSSKSKLNLKGTYDTGTGYCKNDAVMWYGKMYQCIQPTAGGISPASSVHWREYQLD